MRQPSGLTEYGLRREMPWRNFQRAPGTCATLIYRLTLELGAVYEVKGRPGMTQGYR
ncbi:hypothetical protein [Methylorubrum aminovorans]